MVSLARRFGARMRMDLSATTAESAKRVVVPVRLGGTGPTALNQFAQPCAATVDLALFRACVNARRESLESCARNTSARVAVLDTANAIIVRSVVTASLDILVTVARLLIALRGVSLPTAPAPFPISARVPLVRRKWSTS